MSLTLFFLSSLLCPLLCPFADLRVSLFCSVCPFVCPCLWGVVSMLFHPSDDVVEACPFRRESGLVEDVASGPGR